MLLLLMGVAAAVQTATPPAGGGNERLLELLSADDYPAEAVSKRLEGSVMAELRISKDGRVIGCSIIKSSGHRILDDRTCQIFTERARFRPARDQYGQPMEDVYQTPLISWRLGN